MLKVNKKDRDALKEFLMKCNSVNTLFRINNGYDFLVEAVFRNMKEMQDFVEKLERFKIKDRQEFYLLEDLKRESFIADPEYAKILCV